MMNFRRVYLAGPIAGLSYEESALGWRKEFADQLPTYIHCYSPMRGKSYLQGTTNQLGHHPELYKEHPMSTAQAIVARDHNDVFTCDAMVANFLDTRKGSLGTAVEYGWANAYKKPIITIIEPNGKLPDDSLNPHFHNMLIAMSSYVVHDLQTAAHVLTHLLTPGI